MWRRVLREVQNIVQNFKDPMRFQSERLLYDFTKVQDFESLSAYSDASFGGSSVTNLTHNPQEGFVTFAGRCSTEIREASKIKRSGFCGIRSHVYAFQKFLDLSEFSQLVMRIRGTPMPFLANIRVYNFVTGGESEDIWQSFFSCRTKEWHDVRIPLNGFVLTWKGKIVPEVTQMNHSKIMSLGITMSLPADAKEAVDFYLDIASIKATIGDFEE